jgi:hypothetical protein
MLIKKPGKDCRPGYASKWDITEFILWLRIPLLGKKVIHNQDPTPGIKVPSMTDVVISKF